MIPNKYVCLWDGIPIADVSSTLTINKIIKTTNPNLILYFDSYEKANHFYVNNITIPLVIREIRFWIVK